MLPVQSTKNARSKLEFWIINFAKVSCFLWNSSIVFVDSILSFSRLILFSMIVSVFFAGKEEVDFLQNVVSSILLFSWFSNSMPKPYLSLVPVFPVCSLVGTSDVFVGVSCFLLLSSSNKSFVLSCPSISFKFSKSLLRSVTPLPNSSEHLAAFGCLKYSSSRPESSS